MTQPTPTIPAPTPKTIPPPSRALLALLLAGLATLGPFSIDTYLPAFPNIEQTLRADLVEVQQTLTAYMLAFAGMILWHGALSDAFGRRNLILLSLAVFAIGSLGCASAHSIEYLWAFRVMQGVSAGAGVVIGRAIIRDLYADAAAARLLSLVTMIFSIAPALAPILGGWIVKHTDWRTIFLTLFGYTVLLLFFCYKRLPETLPQDRRTPFNPSFLAGSYVQIFKSPAFQLKAGALAFNFAGLFLYVAAAPVFITKHLGLGEDQFAWQFVPAVAGIFLGALLANRFAGRVSIPVMMALGYVLMIGAGAANVVYHFYFPPAIPWSVAPLFFYTLGMSMTAPVLTLLIMDLFPAIRGTVASCQSFTQTMLGAAVAGLVAPFLVHSVLWLALGQLAFALIALGLWLGSRYYHYQHMPPDASVNAWESME
ncbi:MAG: multidrug effflux MFS transporter [Gallionellaceae bacterium]|jgi:DHA1 family bicyclomycin/chloramphenicol resistance-like MFS transporter|nr:multidrug effflux MFS transporter [Gallionellaceae bacterium]